MANSTIAVSFTTTTLLGSHLGLSNLLPVAYNPQREFTLNNHLKNLSFVEANDFNPELSTVKNLEEIYREKGLEDFKKADFAHLISKNAKSKEDLSEEIIKIIEELKA